MIEPSFMLDLFNAESALLSLIFLAFLFFYLRRERKKRGLKVRDYFLLRIPPAMALACAIFVYDLGALIRSGGIFAWRQVYGHAPFNSRQLIYLTIGAVLMTLGGLYKISAITRPAYGNWPWLMSLVAFMLYIVGAVFYFR